MRLRTLMILMILLSLLPGAALAEVPTIEAEVFTIEAAPMPEDELPLPEETDSPAETADEAPARTVKAYQTAIDAPLNTPGRESCGKKNCFWETEMDPYNEKAVWAMLTAPMTVIKGDSRKQANLYAEPDGDSEVIGEITLSAQGVHVLQKRSDGWSKVECYSSSFKGSKVKAWNQLVVGYVPTANLKEISVKTKYGFVVDKLDQRLYIYEEGKLLDVLVVSTGLGTQEEPWNESRSGEFILYTRAGAFPSGNLTCNYGIRYNDGDMLHEVPHIKRESGDNYTTTEPKLGTRASHGCIRVQRKRTASGINMRWIWSAMAKQLNSRFVIWEDWPGRSLSVPAGDTPVYYNPKGGTNYHSVAECLGVKERFLPLTAFTYAELDTGIYADLTPCGYCVPPRRVSEIEAINNAHLFE